MNKRTVLALFLLTALPVRADDAAPDTAVTGAANGFYSLAVGARLTSGGGIPDAAARIRYAPLLSPRLNKALADAAAAEARFKTRNKDSAPLIEGDIFSSLFEGPGTWKVGACHGDANTQRCAIALTRQDPGQKPVAWTDTLILANSGGGWKVDDIAYDANFAFGNTGSLSEMLKMVLSEAP
jgi:hypothetical protein